MSINITSCKYYDEFIGNTGSNRGSDHLIGSVGSKVTCVIDFYVKVSSENIAVITRSSDDTITRTDSGSFIKDGFQEGNSITLEGAGADSGAWVISLVTDKTITVTGSLTTSSTYLNASIYRDNILTASEYYYNLVENDAPDSFVSLSDNQTQQRYVVSGISPTGTTGTYTIAANSKAWAIDSDGFGVTIDGLGISDHKQLFRITQVFVITPIALYSQIENLENGIPPAPDYFADRKCLRHVFKINMKIDKTDPEHVDTITFSRKGNTAWFNEFLNGEDATYSVSNVTYDYAGESVDEIQYDSSTATTVQFTLNNTQNRFTTGTTVTVQMVYIPIDETEYVNTSRKYRDVFAYDRATVTCGAGAVSGINLGTNYSQIFSVTATYVSATQITVSADIKLATALANTIAANESDDRNYLIFVTTQDKTLTQTKSTDMNSVIVDVNSYAKDLDDSTLFTINPNVSYYNASGFNMGSSVSAPAGDIIRAVVPFQVKNSGSQKLYSIGVVTKAVHTGGTDTFVLESWEADTRDYCLDDGVQEIDISQSKNYRLPSSHVLNNITVSRNSSLDTATLAGYTLSYPFFLRYETWRTIENADCDFGDATQNWADISAKSGWSIKQYITAEVYDPATDYTTSFEQSCDIYVKQTGATGDTGAWGVVTTYDNAGTNNQYGEILNYENTTVVANFYGNFSSLPSGTTGYLALLYLDQGNIGGVNWTYPFSSYEDLRQADGLSPWIGATGTTGTAQIVLVSSTNIRVTAKLDYTKLDPSIGSYNLRAKLDYLS